jgi:hypothetical protein
MNDEQATKLAREAALAWRESTDDKEPHTYGETCKGLEALLLSVGYEYTPKNDGSWSDSIGGMLSSADMFHWPLAGYDIWKMTAQQIVEGMLLSCMPSDHDRSRMSPSYWHGFRDYTTGYRSCDRFPIFMVYESETAKKIKADKLRKGSKKLTEFYAKNREHVMRTMREQVEIELVNVQAEDEKKIERIRSEYLPKIDHSLQHVAEQEAILIKLCEVFDKPLPESLVSWFSVKRTEYARRKQEVEGHCEYLRKAIPSNIDELIRDACIGRASLAPFVEVKG